MIKKILTLLLLSIFCFSLVSAVTVVDTSQKDVNTPPVKETSPYMRMFVISIIIIVVGGIGCFILVWIVLKIIKWIKDNGRKHTDKLFGKFKIKLALCQIQKDRSMYYGKWWTFWIFKTRHPVYFRDSDKELKLFGDYEGEMKTREGLDMVAYSRSTGFLQRESYIIMYPHYIRKQLYSKETYFKKRVIVLNCDGLDETLSTDYLQMLLIPDLVNGDIRQPYIDYSNLIQEDFVKNYFYKEVIKENMLDFKDSMKEAVEINPNVQVGRKNPNS